MQLSAVHSVAGRAYAYKIVRSGAWVGEAYQVDHVETGAMSEAGEKQAEFVRLITIPSFVLFVIACVNFFCFGDLWSFKDNLALRPVAGHAISKQLSGDQVDGVRVDTISVRNLTLGSIQILGVQNSCGPCVGNKDLSIPPLGSLTITAWEKASNRHPVYKIYSDIKRDPLEIELTD
ncbi:MAG: hypothetical protein ACK5YR_01340 [Pirellula sp.]|jgi:hypothetical protein